MSGTKYLKRASDYIHYSYKYSTLALTTRVQLRNSLIHLLIHIRYLGVCLSIEAHLTVVYITW
jgi:hypothetical protein